MPTIPPSVFSSTTLRRKYGPWQPLAARIGGSGRAIGVTFRLAIVSGGCAGARKDAQAAVLEALPNMPPTNIRSSRADEASWHYSPRPRPGPGPGQETLRPQKPNEMHHRRRKARSISRLASCFLSASRLSKVLRPLATLSSTFAIPFLK